jgi:hypothetical protein
MQINSANLARLGLTLESAFDPCKSVAAGAAVLAGGYAGGATHEGQQSALRVAISKYNTGDAQRGLANGYVQRWSWQRDVSSPRSMWARHQPRWTARRCRRLHQAPPWIPMHRRPGTYGRPSTTPPPTTKTPLLRRLRVRGLIRRRLPMREEDRPRWSWSLVRQLKGNP